MEYTKLERGVRPSNDKLAESVAMEYDSNFIAHLYNDMHERGAEAEVFHTKLSDGEMIKLPRVEMIIGKNKISEFKGSLYFDFFPASSDFTGVDEMMVAADLAMSKQNKKQNNNKNGYGDANNAGGLYG